MEWGRLAREGRGNRTQTKIYVRGSFWLLDAEGPLCRGVSIRLQMCITKLRGTRHRVSFWMEQWGLIFLEKRTETYSARYPFACNPGTKNALMMMKMSM